MFGDNLLRSIQIYQRHVDRGGLHVLLRKIARVRWIIWSVVTNSDIHPEARVSLDLQLPHPNGVVIHRDAVVGQACIIMQQVTLGQLAEGGAPLIGDGVYIGAGAKILGSVKLGDGARVGANAVVLRDVPAHHTAVGNPARLIKRSSALVSLVKPE